MVLKGQARGKEMEYLLAAVFMALIGYAIYHYTATTPTAVSQVQCGPVLAQVYGLAGQSLNLPAKVVNSLNGKPVSGANIYVFSTVPYGWGQSQEWTLIPSMLVGQTPVATTGSLGNATISVTMPQPNQTETEYMVLTDTGFWSELYTLSVGYNPSIAASSAQQCIQLFPYSTVQNIMTSLIQVQAQDVLNGQSYTLNNLQMEPVGSLIPSLSTLSFNVSQTAYNAQLQAFYAGIVSGGSLRVTGIKFSALGNLQQEGIQQLSVQITAGGQTLYQGVLYNAANSNLPLGNGQNTTYTVSLGGNTGLVDLPQGTTIQVQVSAVANTNTNQTAGYLYSGEQVLQVQFELADPMEGQPIAFTVTG
jgi:hypothetical protein